MAGLKTIWISYDLGLRGDYKGLYTWLDKLKAKECGDSMAVLQIKVIGELVSAVTKNIKRNVKFASTDRVYLIYKEDSTGMNKGRFIIGGRKRAPWEGYGQTGIHGIPDDF